MSEPALSQGFGRPNTTPPRRAVTGKILPALASGGGQMSGGGGVSVPVHHQTTDDPLTGLGGFARAGAGAMKLCIDRCHPTKNGPPTERPPCPASLAKAVPAASHPTNDLPARRPFPTRPSTFSPVRSCCLPTTRQASALVGLGRACTSSPHRTATSAKQSACSKSSRSPAFGLRHYVTPAPHRSTTYTHRPTARKNHGGPPPEPLTPDAPSVRTKREQRLVC
jgi:hypothetical protein